MTYADLPGLTGVYLEDSCIDTPDTTKPGYTVGFGDRRLRPGPRSSSPEPAVTDPTQDAADTCDRVLAYVERADGWDYSVKSARAGLAKSYKYAGPTQQQPAISAAQTEAKSEARGLTGRARRARA